MNSTTAATFWRSQPAATHSPSPTTGTQESSSAGGP